MRAYKANMIPGGTTPVINVSQYDNDYAVTVTLIEGAEIYTPPSGATIRVEGTKPDGHGFEYPCTYQGNVVTMPIYTQMTVVSGRFPIELVVYQSGLRVGSCNIIFAVEKAPLGEDTDISETVIPDIIAGAQAQADAAAASATQAASSAASAETAKDAAMDAAQELQSLLIHDTASGAVASFADGADNIPMQSLIAGITPVQSGSGDPSPSNIRPISGRTGLTVTVQSGDTQNTYPISWQTEAGTVYGGTLDAVSGVLTVDRAIVDIGTLNYTYDSSGGRFYTSVSGKKNESSDSEMMLAISSMYKPMTATAFQSNPTNGTMRGATTGGYVYFRNNAYTDAASFKTAMAGQTLCYKLATPQTYQLTPTEVRTILGGNTVYTDAGAVSVTYVADTKKYIDNKIAELQALVLENN